MLANVQSELRIGLYSGLIGVQGPQSNDAECEGSVQSTEKTPVGQSHFRWLSLHMYTVGLDKQWLFLLFFLNLAYIV
jgi:hypothetical protein